MNSTNKQIIKLGRSADPAALLGDEISGDPQFLHAVLCQLGLPRSVPKERIFKRVSGSSTLVIKAGGWLNGEEWEDLPIPSGTKPRLVLYHICSEAVRTRSTEIEVEDSATGFLRKLGADTGGRNLAYFRRQMLALAACNMQLAYRIENKVTNVKCDPIRSFEAWLKDEDEQRARWPGTVTLSREFFDTLLEHAVPLDPQAIAKLQGSALALDVYTWLAHRLCRVRKTAGVTLYWKNLREQFGQEYKSPRDFQRAFAEALRAAREVYPDARIETARGGITLLPSPPPVRRGAVVVALPKPDASIAASKEVSVAKEFNAVVSADTLAEARRIIGDRNVDELHRAFAKMISGRKVSNPDERFIQWVRRGYSSAHGKAENTPPAREINLSEAALAEARSIAIGWNIDELVERYRTFVAKQETAPTYPDRAFIGWVTKVAAAR